MFLMFLTPSSTETSPESMKTFLTAAPTPAKPEGTELRIRSPTEPCKTRGRGFELPGDDALRAEGWAKEWIDQGQVLVCEVSSDAAAKMKKPALATNYRDCSLGRELCAAPMQRRGLPRSLPSRRKRSTPCSTLPSTESRWTTSRESSSCLPSTTTTRTRSRRSTTRTSGNPPPCSPGRPVWRLPIGTSQPAPHCACAPRDPVCTHSELQLKNGYKPVVCQLGEQHPPATSVEK